MGVPKISNGPDGEFNTYARTRPFIGEGRLFGLGDKVESATFRYTTESIVVVQPPENYGLITDTPTQNLDYGSAGSVITPAASLIMVRLSLLRQLNLSLVFISLVVKVIHNSSVDLMSSNQRQSESSTNSKILPTLDSPHIGDHVLTSKENLLVLPRLQEQEILLAKEDCLVLAIRLKVQPSDTQQNLLLL